MIDVIGDFRLCMYDLVYPTTVPTTTPYQRISVWFEFSLALLYMFHKMKAAATTCGRRALLAIVVRYHRPRRGGLMRRA